MGMIRNLLSAVFPHSRTERSGRARRHRANSGLLLERLEDRTLMSASGTNVLINFDDLPTGTVVTTQYADATFSSAAGYGNVISPWAELGGSPPNTLGAYNPSTTSYNDPTYVDFPKPVSNLKFLALADDNSGQIGTVSVFTNGTLAGSVPIIGDDNRYTAIFVDLSAFQGVTRIEIGANIDPAGLVFDDFQFTVGGPDLVAKTVAWNTTDGGFGFTYAAEGDFKEATTAKVYWAKGTTYADRLSDTAVFTQTIEAGDRGSEPKSDTVHVAGSLLRTLQRERLT